MSELIKILILIICWCFLGFLGALVAKKQTDSIVIDSKLKWAVACSLGIFWIVPIVLIFYIENIE